MSRYRKPPVVEAICEVHFSESSWNDGTQESLCQTLSEDYPQRRELTIVQAQVTMDTAQPDKSSAEVAPVEKRVQYIAPGGDRLIQVARDLVVINRLRPYGHFDDWSPEIVRAVHLYDRITSPRNVVAISLRYLNFIQLDAARPLMEDFFTVYPQIPDSFNAHGPFLLRVQLPVPPPHELVASFATAPSNNPPNLAFALDLVDSCREVSVSSIEAVLRRSHDHIARAFEETCTDLLKKSFEPEDADGTCA